MSFELVPRQWPVRSLRHISSANLLCKRVHTRQCAQPELVDAIKLLRVLPVILDNVDVVRGGQ